MIAMSFSLMRYCCLLLAALWISGTGLVPAEPEAAPAATGEAEAPTPPIPVVPPVAEEPEPAKPGPAPLVQWNREIAVFRSQVTKLSPAERAAQAAVRLDELADQLSTEGVRTEEVEIGEEPGVRFLVGEEYLFSLVESDLDELAGEELSVEAERVIGRLRELVSAREEQKSAGAILWGAGIAVAATVALAIAIWLVRFMSRWSANLLERWVKKWRHLKFHRVDLRIHLIVVMRRLVSLVSWLGVLALVYVWLSSVLSQFPITAPLGNALGEHLRRAAEQLGAGVLSALPGLVTVIVILMIARWLSRLADHLIRSMGETGGDDTIMAADTAKATRRIVVALIWLFSLVVAYPYIPGSGSEAFKGVSVLVGLMISLGSTGMINQVMSGFVMLYSGALRTGEYARIGKIEGTVTEMGMLATKILTPKLEFITVPNAVIISNPTTNFSRLADRHGSVVSASVTIGYDTPWRQVHALLLDAADRTGGVRSEPEPRILQQALSDYYAEYTLIFYIDEPEQRVAVMSGLHGHIQDAFNEHGVQIMSPHFNSQPDHDLVVPKDRWFLPPAQAPAPGEHD